jgi:3-oxoacyl-[acyl-carrier protein] reductase
MNSKYNSINIGDQADIKHKITKEDILKFVDLTGDDNKLHLDEDFAKNTVFKKPVVHGMLGASFISTIIGTKLPGDGALWYSQNLEFLLPVRIGDVITVKAIVLKKNDRDNSIELSTNIYNQNHQKVTAGISKVKIVESIEKKSPIKEVKAKSKTALIIGATGGIGESTVLKLSDDGFNVILHYYKNITSANQICDKISNSKIKKLIVNSDITKKNEVEDMFTKIYRKFDSIDVIVNCSTINFGNIKFENLNWNTIQNHIDINIKGTFNIIKQAMPMMIRNKYGKIINITTQYVDDPKTELLHYITAKSALEGFSRSLALELAPKGIRVNLLSPGMTDTDLISDVPEKTKMVTAAQTPLRKLATPQDIANAVSFLASKGSDFITGETLRVNGGQVMK